MALTKNARIVVACSSFVVFMGAMAYAAVPLYEIFCRITGFGGTTQVAAAVPDKSQISERTVEVRFDATVDPGLSWYFGPRELTQTIKVGDTGLAFYDAKNHGAQPTRGMATYNVTPSEAGKYFTKVACFCFTDQPLAAGASAEMPVSYFIDPAFLEDPDMEDVTTITLSYTFFPQELSADASGATQ
jgi:cytochrome c oxidase assembly protein subunit 11